MERGEEPGEVEGIALGVVLARRDLDLRPVVAAGDPRVTWAVSSELADPTPYLRGGELLLTAGSDLPADAAGVRAYVSALVETGVAALGFGVTPVHDLVPAHLVEQCHRQGLPLIEVPRPTPFAAVGRAVAEALEEVRLRDLRRLGEAHRDMARAISAPDPGDRILRVLASALRAWALVLAPGGGGAVRATPDAPTDPGPETAELLDRLTAPAGPRSAKSRLGDAEVFWHTVGTPPREHGVLLVGRPEPLGVTDRAVLRTATALLDLIARTTPRPPPVPGALVAALLLDDDPGAGAAPLLADLVGAPDAIRYRVLRAVPDGRTRPTPPARLPLPTPVVGALPDGTVRAVLADRGAAAHRADLDALVPHGWIAVIGDPVPTGALAGADRRAGALMARARTVGAPILWEEDADPFASLVDAAGTDAFARRVLGPLAEDDDTARTLRRTLRAWLTRHGGWDRAAADLGVHRNSVRYRIGRIERELGVDLADPEQRMRLWFALTRLSGG
ncbi:PucR family transcriptional regulator [Nocardiopsis sp. N85]|uniref:PucR family transcriptional regulator n=1 Tax=Nocardiopsis sp. N85 TaxID=3029400 RepID=UPI00237F73DB|nr:PucR family transcriptional regulator [Nocardiopsis sp. N85]MDE3722262.1 PucR family transcriptional regulator [Nocardiopsis sp. N85]